jgi:hypothetical protein
MTLNQNTRRFVYGFNLGLDSEIKRILKIKAQLDEIGIDIRSDTRFAYNTDDVRLAYFYSEVDTIAKILKVLSELKAYKESFILLRSVFEKFLYFWLMLDGHRYRWTKHYIVKLNPREKENIEHKTNRIYEEWVKENRSASSRFKDAVQIQKNPKRKDDIIITWEHIGFFEKTDLDEAGRIVPAYNFALDQFNPVIAHVPDLSLIIDGRRSDQRDYLAATHKELYNKFFYFDNNLKNLILNGLISDFQKKQILVHYNFLSAFTHPSKESIKIYANLYHSDYSSLPNYDEDAYEELIVLYAAKLMQLYVKTIIYAYRKNWNILNSNKYDMHIEELNSISRELWFFDNDPIDMDIELSESKKNMLQMQGIDVPSETLYYSDPLKRMNDIRQRRQRRRT